MGEKTQRDEFQISLEYFSFWVDININISAVLQKPNDLQGSEKVRFEYEDTQILTHSKPAGDEILEAAENITAGKPTGGNC